MEAALPCRPLYGWVALAKNSVLALPLFGRNSLTARSDAFSRRDPKTVSADYVADVLMSRSE